MLVAEQATGIQSIAESSHCKADSGAELVDEDAGKEPHDGERGVERDIGSIGRPGIKETSTCDEFSYMLDEIYIFETLDWRQEKAENKRQTYLRFRSARSTSQVPGDM